VEVTKSIHEVTSEWRLQNLSMRLHCALTQSTNSRARALVMLHLADWNLRKMPQILSPLCSLVWLTNAFSSSVPPYPLIKMLCPHNSKNYSFFSSPWEAHQCYHRRSNWLYAYFVVQTDVQGPNAPRIVNLTCHNADTLFLQWHRPSIYNKSIDLYHIYYW
jgi:hypothetical protein